MDRAERGPRKGPSEKVTVPGLYVRDAGQSAGRDGLPDVAADVLDDSNPRRGRGGPKTAHIGIFV